jgi:hypothetical protein
LPHLNVARSSIQIKSHGQKLVGKWEAGENIFLEINKYERMMGSEVQVVSSSETESDYDDDLVEDVPGLIQDVSLMDEDGLLVDWMTPILEPLPSASTLCNLLLPTPKMQVTVKRNISVGNVQENGMHLLHRRFGSAHPISFISSVEDDRCATFSKTPASALRQCDDVLAAVLLCQLSSATNASRRALLTTRLPFSSSESNGLNCLPPRQSIFSFEPIPISSTTSVMERGNESLIPCDPLSLEERTSNVISPTCTAFAEV